VLSERCVSPILKTALTGARSMKQPQCLARCLFSATEGMRNFHLPPNCWMVVYRFNESYIGRAKVLPKKTSSPPALASLGCLRKLANRRLHRTGR
jgi:hypothetical protein